MPADDASFFGHRRGLRVLAASQAWERFSYSGMQTLLVLYCAHTLFQPGHIQGVWGYGLIVAVFGHPTPEALASRMFGLYAGFVYLTPILGGVIADRWLGKTRAVILGAGLLTLGHFLMGEEATFLLALLCLALGVGFYKTSITGQVGDLYAIDDPRRASAYQLFVLFIAVAAVIAPLVCGTLGEKLAWKWGFAAAGVGMVIGLATYLAGRKYLPPEPPQKRKRGPSRPRLTPDEWRVIAILVLLLPVLAVASVGNEQMFNAYLLWGEQTFQLAIGGWTMPVTWLISIDSVIAIAAMTGSLAFWRWWATSRREPDEITKLTIGAMICALAPLILVGAALAAVQGGRVSLAWALPFHAINEIGFANLYPVGMALYSRCAPRGLGSTMIAVYFLHMFAANLFVGWLGGLLGTMSGPAFWLLHAGLIAAAAVILLLVRALAGHILAPTEAVAGASPETGRTRTYEEAFLDEASQAAP
jgi:POT family proton-dependent oligopeptide transporter